jgi:hypothetical protein
VLTQNVQLPVPHSSLPHPTGLAGPVHSLTASLDPVPEGSTKRKAQHRQRPFVNAGLLRFPRAGHVQDLDFIGAQEISQRVCRSVLKSVLTQLWCNPPSVFNSADFHAGARMWSSGAGQDALPGHDTPHR